MPAEKRDDGKRSFPTFWGFPEVNQWLNVLFKRVDNILNSEQIWTIFYSTVVHQSSHLDIPRYVRINPKVGFRAPKMDDKAQVSKLYDDVNERMGTPQMQGKIIRIAQRLVASCFYFEKNGPPRELEDHLDVNGMCSCIKQICLILYPYLPWCTRNDSLPVFKSFRAPPSSR